MKRFGLDRKKVLLVIALAFLMVAIGSAISTHNAIESGMKTLSQNERMTPAPSPQGGLLQAFIFGNPTPNNPFAGVAYNPALNATLPPAVTFFVLGYGNSSVEISWTGATNAITQDFDYNTSIPYTFGAGDYLVEITISSPAIGVSRTVAYNIQVMNYTQYISYENGLNPHVAVSLEPWYIQYEAAEISVALTAITVLAYVAWAEITHDVKEKNQKIFRVK